MVTWMVLAVLAQTPLIDMQPGETYLGQFPGGLWGDGRNDPPRPHINAGASQAALVQPINGKIVLLSVGFSNVTQEWCCEQPYNVPNVWTFEGQLPDVPHNPALVVVNGARAGQAIDRWDQPSDPNYDRVLEDVLIPAGLAESDVQVVWLKLAERNSPDRPSLPSPCADAYIAVIDGGECMRAMKVRWPAVKQVFISSRTYGGYAPPSSNSPEPYAYETGFAVKWLIAAQIKQLHTGVVNPLAGDLSLEVAPWITWGPYLWANGPEPRSDGLAWTPQDVESDGIHPSIQGEGKVADLLLAFFATSQFAPWFAEP